MKLKNAEEYRKSLSELNTKIYYKGKPIKDVTRHPATAPHVRAAAMTYAIVKNQEHRDLATATSHLTGKTISRFSHVSQNVEDLIKKVKLLRVLGQLTGTCFQRCVGLDGINATYSVVYEIDQKYGTDYLERFKKWLTYIQDENLMVVGAMTGGTALVESMHGAGSPQAQRVMILREGELEKKIKLAKALMAIPGD